MGKTRHKKEEKSATRNSERNSNKTFKQILKRFSWEEYALAAILLAFFIWWAVYTASYTQIPGPMFGGDVYRDRAFVQNIVAGNPFWSDAFYANEINYYPYFIFIIQATIVKLTGLSIESVFLFFPLFTLLAGGLAWYGLGLRLFKEKRWGLVTVLAFLSLHFVNTPLASGFAVYASIPAFLYFWLKYEQEKHRKDAVYAGLLLGLTSIVYGGKFLAAASMFCFTILWFYIVSLYKEQRFWKVTKEYFAKYWIILAITAVLAATFFGPLIIKYHWHDVNQVSKWGDTGIHLLGPVWVLTLIKSMFYDSRNAFTIIASAVAIVGAIALVFRFKEFETKFIITIIATNIVAMEHHLITKPLLNTWFLPEKLFYFTYLLPLFVALGIVFICSKIKKPLWQHVITGAVAVLLVTAFYFNFERHKESQWEKVGRSDPSYRNALLTLGDTLRANAGKEETILSNDETGFMLASVSGRKVVLTRRTHASYFIDIDERIADVAVAMYGNDPEMTKKIIQKYNAKYFYVDQYLLQNDMRTSPRFKEYLTKYNVTFTEVFDRYDVAVPPGRANMLYVLVISPQNINQEFATMWEPKYAVQVGNQQAGLLYVKK